GMEVISHTKMIEEIRKNMVTKDIYNVLDEIVRIVRKLDQERIFTVEWVERIEGKVEQNTQDIEKNREEIKKIKERIGME
ncbi:MAG: hypothetical protein ACP5OB_07400, partial [Candidatus Ratteibacteria bacterium]